MAEYIVGAATDEIERDEDLFKAQDPFNKSWDDIK